jgi:hypothetical protein
VVSPAEGAVVDPNNTVIEWEPVTQPAGIEIAGYQVIVELPDPLRVFSVDLPSSDTSVTVPAEFLDPGSDYKFEVLAVADNANQTIHEGTWLARARRGVHAGQVQHPEADRLAPLLGRLRVGSTRLDLGEHPHLHERQAVERDRGVDPYLLHAGRTQEAGPRGPGAGRATRVTNAPRRLAD